MVKCLVILNYFSPLSHLERTSTKDLDESIFLFISEAKIYFRETRFNASGQRLDTGDYCFFCGKLVARIYRHFRARHSTEPEVKEYNSSKSFEEKRHKQADLLRKGNHKHNMQVILEKKGDLRVARSPAYAARASYKDFLPCHLCFTWFRSAQLYRHHCPMADGESRPSLKKSKELMVLCNLDDSSEEMARVLAGLADDKIGQIVNSDALLVDFLRFKVLTRQVVTRKDNDNMRSKLRYGGRLLAEMRKDFPTQSLADVLTSQNFDRIAKAAKACAMTEAYGESAETATKIGHVLCGCIRQAIRRACHDSDHGRLADLKSLLRLMRTSWNKAVPRTKKSPINKMALPRTCDIVKIAEHLEEKLEQAVRSFEADMTVRTYEELQKAAVLRIFQFNRTSGYEVTSLTVRNYTMAAEQAETRAAHVVSSCLTAEQKERARTHHLIVKNSGKFIILDAGMKKAVDLLQAQRAVGGNAASNVYLFALSGTWNSPVDHRSWLKNLTTELGVTNVCPTQMRMYLSSALQVFLQVLWRYTHKTSGFKTSGFKMSGFKTSGLQNVRFTKSLVSKRPVSNVRFQNVHRDESFKTSVF